MTIERQPLFGPGFLEKHQRLLKTLAKAAYEQPNQQKKPLESDPNNFYPKAARGTTPLQAVNSQKKNR